MRNYKISKPTYYSIIPADVRYDKDLMDKAKLIYSEITALSNSMGYCYASNQYFADLYSITIRQVQTLLKDLSNKGYIKVDRNSKPRKIHIATVKKTSPIIIQVIIIKRITLRHRSWCLSSKRGIQNIRIHEMKHKP